METRAVTRRCGEILHLPHSVSPPQVSRFQTPPDSAEIFEIPSLVTEEKKAAAVPQKNPRLLAQTQTAKKKK